MNKPTHHRTISELTDRGWKIIYNDSTGEAVSIRSVIRHWNKLTWAQQAYYHGKYGFSERSVLDIGISGHSTTPANSGLFSVILNPQQSPSLRSVYPALISACGLSWSKAVSGWNVTATMTLPCYIPVPTTR